MAKETDSEKKKEDWMNSKWRPMMGWMYMLVCTMDFIGFPVLWSLLQAYTHGNVTSQWQPLTLQGAGLFHLAMGAVIGISAYGRTQEKLNGAEGGGLGSFGPGAGTTYVPPNANVNANMNLGNQPGGMNNNSGFGGSSSFGGGSSSGFGSSSSGFGGSSSGFGSSSSGFGSSPSGFGSSSTPSSGFGSTPSTPASSGFGGGFGSTSTPASTTTNPAVNSTLPPAPVTPAMAAAGVTDPSTAPLADPTVDPNAPVRRAKS